MPRKSLCAARLRLSSVKRPGRSLPWAPASSCKCLCDLEHLLRTSRPSLAGPPCRPRRVRDASRADSKKVCSKPPRGCVATSPLRVDCRIASFQPIRGCCFFAPTPCAIERRPARTSPAECSRPGRSLMVARSSSSNKFLCDLRPPRASGEPPSFCALRACCTCGGSSERARPQKEAWCASPPPPPPPRCSGRRSVLRPGRSRMVSGASSS
mmetsp:Transcript_60558/g.180063  ORF Transcript_60558/g.180063 Transcript_60558/m.180063 type:complete len:211 (-) Transcript_60558:1060-1692(-)